ncbi:unnamed protein product [Plutella xylostella]|uniref:(diamondback moth) hypothetical protein n=1 Tax=Plutella xylostella TaxID=51655 RepID=A0A8S4GAS3_PLUXY|nr:unnamed protein product [Plutella xylostella]
MSIIEVVEHNEVIYTILKQPPPPQRKTPRYQSKLEKELKATKIPKRTGALGFAETPLNPPDKFLKKGEGVPPPRKQATHKCVPSKNLPPVFKRSDMKSPPEKPTVNFKVLNIKKAIKSKPKPIVPRLVDTRNGHTKSIKGSGEVPEMCLRRGFGQLPTYLAKRVRRQHRRLQAKKDEEDNRESLCKLVADEERQKLLDDLKANWAIMQKAFLQLPMLTDTIPKINKKAKMEQDLKQLEKDIALVENNPYIYVFDDQLPGPENGGH